MAIDKQKTRELLAAIDNLFHQVAGGLPKSVLDWVQARVMGKAREEVRRLIENSRPPVLYLVGRSGHGKSSLINALANRPVAEVGHVKPTTPQSIPYTIPFEGLYSTWEVIDSRGIFESTRPGGAPSEDAVEHVRRDVLDRRPDVILHLIAAPEVRNLANDLRVFRDILDALKAKVGTVPPVVVVLTKADTLGNPRQWSPEQHPAKAELLRELLMYMVGDVLGLPACKPAKAEAPERGCVVEGDSPVRFVVPVATPAGEEAWNVETLSELIGEVLPGDARLEFFQAQRRKELLRKMSSDLIKRFAGIATTVGASPLPVSDFLILAPLQLLMIALVGGLSCRPFSTATAFEFLGASGASIALGRGFRTVAQQLVKLVPIAGDVISAAIAGAGTYAIGKSAESYFFLGQARKPEEFRLEWKPGENEA